MNPVNFSSSISQSLGPTLQSDPVQAMTGLCYETSLIIGDCFPSPRAARLSYCQFLTMFLLDLVVLHLWNFRNGRSGHGHQCKLLSAPGLPQPHKLSPRCLSALWYRWIQDFVVMKSIFLNHSERSERLSFLNVFKPFSPAVDGAQPCASFHQPAWCDIMRTCWL